MDDTLAQWLMTLLTLTAVVLVYFTLRDTRIMAAETTRIGEAQVRAYLSFEVKGADVRAPSLSPDNTDEPKPNIVVEIQGRVPNSGQSPASSISFLYQIDALPRSEEFRLRDERSLHRTMPVAHTVRAQGEIENQSLKRTFRTDLEALRSGDSNIFFAVIVEWVDVFEEIVQSEPVFGTIPFKADADGVRQVYFGRVRTEKT
ncbi:hypothetical protein AB2B41_07650 [Marimonas sp. MJW-29]|uniref:Uncharacterized protein n=1 Tax=Sulfitobacter sediminis TaxID=3234186 RepID=A0ABV3RLB0_9RHOB